MQHPWTEVAEPPRPDDSPGDGTSGDLGVPASGPAAPTAAGARPDDGLWISLAAILRWRWFIVAFTLLVGAASVAITLAMPNWYAASARVLPPEASGANPITAALMRNAGSAASALLGGVSSDYARYLAILSSRRVLEGVVEEFDLVRAYELQDKEHPEDEALRQLQTNVSFPVDEDYEFLSVVVFDTNPERAARMANYMVAQLNAINTELSSRTASNYRRFVERRSQEAQVALDSLMDEGQAFQQRYGILDLDVQTQAYFTQLAELRAGATLAEIQYEALRSQLGEENDEVRALGAVASAAQGKVATMMAGGEAVLPVAQAEMSDVARGFLDLRREAEVQRQILEVVQPLVEQARFEEEKQVEAVQVVDAAEPPVRKVKPRRSVLVIVATVSGFLLATLFVLLYTAWQRKAAYVAYRLRTA